MIACIRSETNGCKSLGLSPNGKRHAVCHVRLFHQKMIVRMTRGICSLLFKWICIFVGDLQSNTLSAVLIVQLTKTTCQTCLACESYECATRFAKVFFSLVVERKKLHRNAECYLHANSIKLNIFPPAHFWKFFAWFLVSCGRWWLAWGGYVIECN